MSVGPRSWRGRSASFTWSYVPHCGRCPTGRRTRDARMMLFVSAALKLGDNVLLDGVAPIAYRIFEGIGWSSSFRPWMLSSRCGPLKARRDDRMKRTSSFTGKGGGVGGRVGAIVSSSKSEGTRSWIKSPRFFGGGFSVSTGSTSSRMLLNTTLFVSFLPYIQANMKTIPGQENRRHTMHETKKYIMGTGSKPGGAAGGSGGGGGGAAGGKDGGGANGGR